MADDLRRSLFATAVAALVCGCIRPSPASAADQAAGAWEFQAALYVYLPSLSGSSAFPPEDGSSSIGFDTASLLDHLKMTFMGSFQARQGPWGALTDLIYIDLGNSKTVSRGFSIGGMPLPSTVTARTDLDIRGWLWTLAATYRPIAQPQYSLDVLAGVRMLDIRETITWQLSGDTSSIAPADRAGSRGAHPSNWDGIAGVKGRVSFGPDLKWFGLYYVDLGAGDSRFTDQLLAGGGYAFQWGEVLAAWRYIDYQMKSGQDLERLSFSGPLVAVQFRW